jgi:hypothetical protein
MHFKTSNFRSTSSSSIVIIHKKIQMKFHSSNIKPTLVGFDSGSLTGLLKYSKSSTMGVWDLEFGWPFLLCG